jgi:hypothetical protein
MRKTLFIHQTPYFAEVVGMVGSPAISSVQTTLDGDVLSTEEFEEAVEELTRAPCDKKCLLALEDECRCRCGGVNHGKWVKSADHDSSLDVFGSEGGPIVSHDIARGKLALMLVARREVAAAYYALFGGLQK